MALHDLGVATGMLGDSRESLALVEQSMELARAANDRYLMSRCYINVPAIRQSNGETTAEIMPLLLEGLDRARRSMDHSSASWIAENVASVLAFEGRLEEALTYAEEAVVNAGVVGEQGRLAACTAARAFIRLAMGDRAGSRAEVEGSRRRFRSQEPQSMIYDAVFDAFFGWPDDPLAACRSISDALHSPDAAPASLLDTAPIAARMALRLGDAARLASALAAFVAVAGRCSGPLRAMQRRWLEALRAGEASAISVLHTVADEFEAIGYRLPAADCHADAALLSGRAGLDPIEDEAAARRLYTACGAVPVLDEPRGARSLATEPTTAHPA
jgi:hypothetical protein